MNYILLGSLTSPFVRRIRMLMENIPYEFKDMKIFEAQDALELNKINPINQIPVLMDSDLKIWDSRQIFNYLNLIHKLHNMSWEDENTLTAIDGALNAGVSLLMMNRSGIELDDSVMYIRRQKERNESILDYLKPYLKTDALKEWNFLTMSLYSFLDWALYRNLINIEARPECLAFLDAHAERAIVKLTQIPKVT